MQQLTLFAPRRAWDARQLCHDIVGAARYKARWYNDVRAVSHWQQQYIELAAEAERLEFLCQNSMPPRADDDSNLEARWTAVLPYELADAVQALEDRYDFVNCESGRWRLELIPNNEAAWKSKTAPLWREPENPNPTGRCRNWLDQLVGV